MTEINQSMVYFKCGSCDHAFEADPEFFGVTCPQCGGRNTYRI